MPSWFVKSHQTHYALFHECLGCALSIIQYSYHVSPSNSCTTVEVFLMNLSLLLLLHKPVNPTSCNPNLLTWVSHLSWPHINHKICSLAAAKAMTMTWDKPLPGWFKILWSIWYHWAGSYFLTGKFRVLQQLRLDFSDLLKLFASAGSLNLEPYHSTLGLSVWLLIIPSLLMMPYCLLWNLS